MTSSERAVDQAVCSDKIPARVNCPDSIDTHAAAVRLLAEQPHCLDETIEALKRFAVRSPTARADLAAAYYVRAQRDNRALDLILAWEEATRAASATTRPAAALFNLALIEEALELPASWDAVIASGEQSPWSEEARQHRDRLERERGRDVAAQWAATEKRLKEVLDAGDSAAIDRLIAPFPFATERFLEGQLSKPENADELKLLGEAMSRVWGDRFGLDIAGAVAANTRLGHAIALFQKNQLEAAVKELRPLEREARARRYLLFAPRVRALLAACRLFQGRYLDAIADYDVILSDYRRLRDEDGIADTLARGISPFNGAGHYESAWQHALQACRHRHALTGPRHVLFGETAGAVLALNHSSLALRYQNEAINIAASPPNRIALAAAHRQRADILLHLNDVAAAQTDLKKSQEFSKSLSRERRHILDIRAAEIRGRIALKDGNTEDAIAAFTKAIASSRESHSIQGSLYSQRADAFQLAGRMADALDDRKRAVREYQQEQERTLKERKLGAGEDIWSAYFSRLQPTYRSLIGQLVDANRVEEAFRYVEQAHAYEPLRLVMSPAEIEAITLREIRTEIQPDAALLAYLVFDDHVLVWIIARDRFEVKRLAVKREQIEQWTATLQSAGARVERGVFEAGLDAPFDALLSAPLKRIGATAKRLVIIPDGPMHGLPYSALHNPDTGRYLMQDYAVSIAGSAKLYVHSLRRDAKLAAAAEPRPPVLLIGDPTFDRSLPFAADLRPLFFARYETDRIGRYYGSRVEVRLYQGKEATLRSFFDRAASSAVIHIAAHAIANVPDPSQSMILFAPEKDDHGVLNAGDLLRKLKLDRTRLVVLAACSSAGGLPVGPEGVAPLVRPLIAAGVPAVVGSLWDVNDATAAPLLVSFHRHYGQSSDAAIALQSAQIELLRDKNQRDFQSPATWGAFQVVGYGSSPFAAPRRY